MARLVIPEKMLAWSIWALWWFLIGGAGLWLLVGTVAYWVKHGWLPADTSGWVQAIGSVAAIVAAAIIASHQHVVAERKHKKDRRQNGVGRAARLFLFALEYKQVMNEVVLPGWQPGIDLVDLSVADTLERMLARLNQNFDDDLELVRNDFLYKLRISLAGSIFTLRATNGLDPMQRDETIQRYRIAAEQLCGFCNEHFVAVRDAA